jgi:hypothetical protein
VCCVWHCVDHKIQNYADEMAKKGGKVNPKAKVGVSVGTKEKGKKYAARKLEKGPTTCKKDNDTLIIKGKFSFILYSVRFLLTIPFF